MHEWKCFTRLHYYRQQCVSIRNHSASGWKRAPLLLKRMKTALSRCRESPGFPACSVWGRAVESHVHFSASGFYPPSWFFWIHWKDSLKPSKSSSISADFQLGFHFWLCELVKWAFPAGLQQPLPQAQVCCVSSSPLSSSKLWKWESCQCTSGLLTTSFWAQRRTLFLVPLLSSESHQPQHSDHFSLQVCLAASCIASVRHGPLFRETETSLQFSVLLRKEFKDRLKDNLSKCESKTPGQSRCKPWQLPGDSRGRRENKAMPFKARSWGSQRFSAMEFGKLLYGRSGGGLSLQRIKRKGSDN